MYVIGIAENVFCLARSFLALRDRLWPWETFDGLARSVWALSRSFWALRDRFGPCEIVLGLARSFFGLAEIIISPFNQRSG